MSHVWQLCATDGFSIGGFFVATKFRFAFPPVIAASLILALLLPAPPAQEEAQWRLDTVFSIGEERKPPKDAIPGSDVNGWWRLPITNVNPQEYMIT